jgi:hypothetical protein
MDFISDYGQGLVKFSLYNFSNICLITALFILVTNTVQMKDDPDKTANSDSYYAINVAGIVTCGIFIINHFVTPYLPSNNP